MSIVIPARHLAHTVITVRCDSPHAPPHIECGVDGQAAFANASREHTKSPQAFSSGLRLTSSTSTTSSLPSNPAAASQTDLSVERGMDHRGHFVRLSFLPAQQTSSGYGHRFLGHGMADASLLALESGLSGPTQSVTLPQESSPFRTTSSPASMSGSPLAYSPVPTMNNTRSEADSSCLENINFMCPSDAELITALDSFMGIFEPHNSDYPMLDVGVPGNFAHSQQLSHPSEPASPEMSSASSSSCGSRSPTTPYDCFLPAATPINDGGSRDDNGGASGARDVQRTSGRVAQSPPALSPLAPGPEQKTVLSNKTESRLLPCPQPGCKRQFKSTSTLGGHMKTHAGKGVRFPCSFPPCTEKFSRRHDQLRHEVYKHGKQCEWVCSRCNSFFSYERSLEKHTCTMDKSRRGSMPYSVSTTSGGGPASGAAR